jgi:hypothetical protein
MDPGWVAERAGQRIRIESGLMIKSNIPNQVAELGDMCHSFRSMAPRKVLCAAKIYCTILRRRRHLVCRHQAIPILISEGAGLRCNSQSTGAFAGRVYVIYDGEYMYTLYQWVQQSVYEPFFSF